MRMDDATEHADATAAEVKQSQSFTGFAPSGSTLCPQCDYDLQGLSTLHACPECHLAFDKATRVWRKPLRFKYSTRRNTLIYLFVFSFLTFMLYLLDAAGPLIRADYRSLPIAAFVVTYAGMCISLGVALVIALLHGKTFANGPFAAITPDKLILRRSRFEKTTLIDWENIAELFVTSAFAGVVVSEKRDGQETQYGLIDFFHTLQQLFLFCDFLESKIPRTAALYRLPTRHERLAFPHNSKWSQENINRINTRTNQLQRRMELYRLKDIRNLQLTECPKCEYRLHIGPDRKRCPECGLEYDDQSISWLLARGQDMGPIEVIQFLIVLGVPLGLMAVIDVRGISTLIHPYALAAIFILLGVVLLSCAKGRIRVALLPDGIWLRRGNEAPTQVLYEDIAFASICTQRGHFRLHVWSDDDRQTTKTRLSSGTQSIGTAIVESLYKRSPNIEIRLCP